MTIVAIAVGLTLLAATGCGRADRRADSASSKAAPMNDSLAQIHNADLEWDGTMVGLQPRIANPATARLVEDPAVSDAALRALLDDPDRFAIAHVLLTLRARSVTSFDAEQWNGLHVVLEASGAVRYDLRDARALSRQWAEATRAP